MTLKQSLLFTSREFELQEHGLLCKSKNIRSSFENTIPYEDIYTDKLIKKDEKNLISIIATLLLAVVFIVNLTALISNEQTDFSYTSLSLVFILMILSGLGAYLGRTNEILIYAVNKNSIPQHIIFFENKPNKTEVKNFLESLETKIKVYIKEKYSKIDHDYPIEPQLRNFAWLRDRNAITDDEFEQLKDKALKRETSVKVIGFKPNSGN